MADRVNRRNLIQAGGLLIASSLAGCGFDEETSYTSISIRNRSDNMVSGGISVLDPDGANQDDSTWFSEGFDLDAIADDGEADSREFDQAFEMRKAVVEVESNGLQEQFIYYPYCTDDDRDDILNIVIQTQGNTIRWRRACLER